MRLVCRRRRCSWCGVNVWKPYVQAGMMSGLDDVPGGEILLVTLTAPGDVEVEAWNESAAKCWNTFITYLRRTFPGAQLEFWKVAELQERGAVHYHIVLRGLRWLPVEILRALAVSAGFGRWVWIGRPERRRGGVKGLLGYYGKYMVKGTRFWELKQHVSTHSRDWRQGWVQHGSSAVGASSSWSYCACELDAYVILKAREAVIEGQQRGQVGPSPSWRLLTAGVPPPVNLDEGDALL